MDNFEKGNMQLDEEAINKVQKVKVPIASAHEEAVTRVSEERTNLVNCLRNEKVIVRLNKPVILESIPVLFDIISASPMRSKYLKYFYVLHAFNPEVTDDNDHNKYLQRLLNCMRFNKVMRKLSFAKPSKFYYEIKNDEEEDGFHTFRYIKKRDYDSVIFLMKAMRKLLGYKENNKEEIDSLIRNIIMYRFSTYRKFIIK